MRYLRQYRHFTAIASSLFSYHVVLYFVLPHASARSSVPFVLATLSEVWKRSDVGGTEKKKKRKDRGKIRRTTTPIPEMYSTVLISLTYYLLTLYAISLSISRLSLVFVAYWPSFQMVMAVSRAPLGSSEFVVCKSKSCARFERSSPSWLCLLCENPSFPPSPFPTAPCHYFILLVASTIPYKNFSVL